MFSKRFFIVVAAAVASATTLWAQTTPAPAPPATTTAATAASAIDGGDPSYLKAETPEQRKMRLGTPDDPGPNPDPGKHYWRFGRSYHIEKYDRRWENYEGVEMGFVRPYGFLNVSREVYQRNDKWVWVWMPDTRPEDVEASVPQPESKYNDAQTNYLQDLRPEFSELTPKASPKAIRFEESSEGLPNSGSWRNSLAVADMNNDGCADIIAPPERKGGLVAAIFLGDCKGHWKFWSAVKWPRGVDYGSVVAADFNKDGHMDVAFGVHLRGIFVMLGDGKGNFTEVSQGLPRDFGTRRIVAADIDRDGYPDLVAISEGPSAASVMSEKKQGKIRVYYNRKKGTAWEEADVAGADKRTAGDWLTIANLTGDSHPDMIAATIYQNSNDVVYVSDGPKKWKPVNDAYLVPYLSYYSANAAGKFSSKKYDDALVAYNRAWPSDAPSQIPDPPSKNIVGIDRISLVGTKPKRTPIVRWAGMSGIAGLAVGDFDGDGNLDLIYTRFGPREAVILLGDGKGGFTRAQITGLTLEPNANYDVKVADVNGDGKPDVIVMYESSGAGALSVANGSIHVFLNRGVGSSPMQAEK
jgi:hypothetical protein